MAGKDNNSSNKRRQLRRLYNVLCVVLSLAILGLGGYALKWFNRRARTIESAGRYQAMYANDATPVPPLMPSETVIPDKAASGLTGTPTPEPTAAPDGTAEGAASLVPNASTLVLSLPTPPPVQASFQTLLEHNSDTVGFLTVEGMLSLPVAQRVNDNQYYLTHNFDGEESVEGALFMDGINRLVPEDDCLIVYGHNMKDGTMFGLLHWYETEEYMRAHPLIRFDTLYDNRAYVPVAAFAASTNPSDSRYFEVRRFVFDDGEFEVFLHLLKAHSLWPAPVDVRYGDGLLLLVTCEHANSDGRFILALRQIRPDEDPEAVAELIRTGA